MSRALPSYAALVLGVLGVLVSLLTGLLAIPATAAGDPFVNGRVYRGDFPDPWVLRVGSTYYAYATNTADLTVPMLTSTDLRTWRARGNVLPRAARCAVKVPLRRGQVTRSWAPSVTRVRGRYLLAYSAPLAHSSPRKRCLSIAVASRPQGPFVDRSRRPILCHLTQNAIDPQIFVTSRRVPYLIWKSEGRPGVEPSRLWSRRLTARGTALARGSVQRELLRTEQPWEGTVIENPALIQIGTRLYLFYSANGWGGPNYAIGYALCTSPEKPCVRPTDTPLLAGGGAISGPGGEAPFRDAQGRLRLAYAAWDFARTGYQAPGACQTACNQRRLHVATLAVDSAGLLSVVDPG